MHAKLPPGKLPAPLLADLLHRFGSSDPRLLVPPGIGRDAAVLDFGDHYLVAKTDPITFATDEMGWYAVQVNANDIACLGATPRWFMACLLLPAGWADVSRVEAIFGQIYSACIELGVSLIGGHTEVTHGLDRPIVSGTMLGEVVQGQLVLPGGTQPGDQIVLTKGFPVEGTALIAREKASELAGQFPADFLDHCRQLLHRPGISVVPEARLAGQAGGVHAMHDPTEGGIATGLWEMAEAAGVRIEVDRDVLPLLPEGAILCRRFGLDPLGLIASGSLLLAVAPDRVADLRQALESANIRTSMIGCAVDGTPAVNLPRFDQDEITRLFD